MKATPVLHQTRSTSTLKSPGARAIAEEHARELAKLRAIYETAAKARELIDAATTREKVATPSKRKASVRKAITAVNKLLDRAYTLVPESDHQEVYERVSELLEETVFSALDALLDARAGATLS